MKIFLIGFMGSGKTYWGKVWAKEMNYAFFDLDEEIEKKEHQPIDAIFAASGEDHFRFTEAEALRSFKETDQCIIACGGGTACFHNNLTWMNENGITVYLQASPYELTSRLIDERSKRPLIKNIDENDLLLFIEKKLHERETFYLQAQFVVPIMEANYSTIKAIINVQ